MDDLISRSELTQAIKRQYCTDCDSYDGLRCRACHADDMMALVDDAHSVDAVPVVRCRECENSEPCPVAGVDYIYCNEWARISEKNGYCHCGTKMDGGDPHD